MIEINRDQIQWEDQQEQWNLLGWFLGIILAVAILTVSFFAIRGFNQDTKMINSLIMAILMVMGLILRKKYLLPEFNLAMEIFQNYQHYKGVESVELVSKLKRRFLGSLLGAITLPTITSLLIISIAGLEALQLVPFHPISIALGILTNPVANTESGELNKEKVTIRHNMGGKVCTFVEETKMMDKIGLIIEPGFLFIKENITMALFFGEYYYISSLKPDKEAKEGIQHIANWCRSNLGIPTFIYDDLEKWKTDLGEKKEMKNFCL